MTQNLEGMRETAAMIGLKINIQKTKSLRVNQGNNATFNIGGDEIQDVKKFTYLGSIVSGEGGTDQDIVARIERPQVRNEDLWNRAEQQPLHLQVSKRKRRWLGHTLRKPFVNVTRHALDGHLRVKGAEDG